MSKLQQDENSLSSKQKLKSTTKDNPSQLTFTSSALMFQLHLRPTQIKSTKPQPRWWFPRFFMFIPPWGNNPMWQAYFSVGLGAKQPTSAVLGWTFQLSSSFLESKAHCRDLERLGYPSPCPVEQLLLDPPSQQSTLDAPEMRRPSAETVEAEGLMMMWDGRFFGGGEENCKGHRYLFFANLELRHSTYRHTAFWVRGPHNFQLLLSCWIKASVRLTLMHACENFCKLVTWIIHPSMACWWHPQKWPALLDLWMIPDPLRNAKCLYFKSSKSTSKKTQMCSPVRLDGSLIVWIVIISGCCSLNCYMCHISTNFISFWGEKSFAAMTEMQERCNHQQNVARFQRLKTENVVDLKGTQQKGLKK